MLIKASRITSLTDARYFAAKEVDFLGFNLEEGTEGYLDPMYMKAIREWVEGPRIVGEFSASAVETVREAAVFFGLDAVQVSAREHGNRLSELAGLSVFLDMDLAGKPENWEKQLQETAGFVAFYLIRVDTNWRKSASQLQAVCARYPVLLRFSGPAGEVPALLAALPAAGLELLGGEEEQVGVKSFDELEDVFEAIGQQNKS